MKRNLTQTIGHYQTRARDERERRDWRDGPDTKFEVLGSKFRRPRTSDLELSPHAAPFSPVSRVSLFPARRAFLYGEKCIDRFF